MKKYLIYFLILSVVFTSITSIGFADKPNNKGNAYGVTKEKPPKDNTDPIIDPIPEPEPGPTPIEEPPVIEDPITPPVEEPPIIEPIPEPEPPIVEEPIVEDPIPEPPVEEPIEPIGSLNVLDFGAKNDINFNSTSAFTNAINSLQFEQTLFIPDGTYSLDSLSMFNKSNIIISGESLNVTLLKNGTNSDGQIDSSNINFKNITFENFDRFKFYNNNSIAFNNCHFNNFQYYGIYYQYGDNLTIDNCSFNNVGEKITSVHAEGAAIYLFGNSSNNINDVKIINSYFTETKGDGAIFLVNNINNYLIQNNLFENTAYSAVHHWALVSNVDTNMIKDNDIYGAGLGALANNDIVGRTSGVGASGIFCNGQSNKVSVLNNYIENSVENGIEGDYKETAYNTIINTGIMPIRQTPSTEGIWINGNQTYIHHNKIIGADHHGISTTIGGTIQNIRIEDNEISCLNGGAVFLHTMTTGVAYSNVIVKNNILSNDVMLINDHSSSLGTVTLDNNTILGN